MKNEDFPIGHKTLDRWIEYNKNNVKYPEIKNDRYIYVNFSMVRLQTAYILPKILFALGMAEAQKAQVIAITWKPNDNLKALLESYGIIHLDIESLIKKDVNAFTKALSITASIYIRGGKGEELNALNYKGIPVGRCIYEDILRTSELSTIKSANNKTCMKKILHLLWMFNALDSYLKRHKPLFCVADDLAYHEGMQSALFYKHGAKLSNVSWGGVGRVLFDDQLRTIRWPYLSNRYCHEHIDSVKDDDAEKAIKYLEERFRGKNGRNIDRGAFAGKKVWDRSEGVRQLGLDPDKKNIVIMAHTFTDAIYNYGDTFFRDYYDWTEKTLGIAEEIDSVNWILKPHPTRKAYHEEKDSIESMFERHKKTNIHFLSDEVSSESIKNIADAIITIGGNAGAEYACYGIPVVIVGTPYYKGFGYSLEPKNLSEYRKCLFDMPRINKLNDEQVLTARKVFYLQNCSNKKKTGFKDELTNIVKDGYKKMLDKMALEFFDKNEGTQKFNDELTEDILSYFEKNDYRTVDYYNTGKNTIV